MDTPSHGRTVKNCLLKQGFFATRTTDDLGSSTSPLHPYADVRYFVYGSQPSFPPHIASNYEQHQWTSRTGSQVLMN